MKKFTNIVLIIAMICVIIGVICCGCGIAMGGTFGEIKQMIKDGHYSWDWVGWNDEEGSIENQTTYYDSAEIQNLSISINAGTLDIKQGDGDKIQVDVQTHGGKVAVAQKADTLSIEDKTKSMFGNRHIEITLYLPEKVSFDEVDIDVDAGEVVSDYDTLDCKKLTLNVDAGHMSISNVKASDTADISVGAGEMEIAAIEVKDLKMDTGVGKMEITGSVTGDVVADCGVGELDLTLANHEQDFNYEVDCGLGEIKVGSNNFSGFDGTKSMDNNALQDMTIDGGVGSIKVAFK